MTEVCLGVDPNVRRLGLALVAFEPPHEVLWADTVSIDRVDGGWTHEQVRDALFHADISDTFQNSREVVRIGIEIPPHVNNTQTFRQLSVVFGLVGAECHRRWPWAPQVSCDVQQWKKGVLGKGNAPKSRVLGWAMEQVAPGRRYHGSGTLLDQDSADAIAIATYAAGVELVEREKGAA